MSTVKKIEISIGGITYALLTDQEEHIVLSAAKIIERELIDAHVHRIIAQDPDNSTLLALYKTCILMLIRNKVDHLISDAHVEKQCMHIASLCEITM